MALVEHSLRGACSCGRNQYIVLFPQKGVEGASVYFDSSSESRRTHAAPLTAFLRVPLSWYQSHTISFYDDETHSSIRRTYTHTSSPHTKRNFCGFCGTPLSSWSELPSSEADYLSVTLGSLFGSDIRSLDELGLLPPELPGDALSHHSVSSLPSEEIIQRAKRQGTHRDIDWFEEMIEGSRLGRTQRKRRGHGGDSNVQVEWEVSEWPEAADPGSTMPITGKRKLDDSQTAEVMQQ